MSDFNGVYRCGCPLTLPMKTAAGPEIRQGIDLHCHILVPEVEQKLAHRPELAGLRAGLLRQTGAASQAHNEQMIGALMPRLIDIDTRLRDMDVLGVDIQVLSPSPTQYHYWADADIAAQIVDAQNDRLAQICARHPDRFLALGAIAMQHPELALRQLENLMTRGFKGVEISTRIGELELADPVFEPFWKLAAESGSVVFIHPLGSSLGERLASHYLSNVIGQPIETTIALSGLIFSGVLDRHPTLKICAAHGGGYLPGFFGRSDHAHAVRPESRICSDRPSAYLRRIWFDTVVHDPSMLANLIAIAGVSQVVLGTDYPFDMGEYRVGALLESIPGLAAEDRDAIVSGNARRLLNL